MNGIFRVFLACEDLTFGASLPKNITYAEFVNVARNKFNIGQEYDTVLSYNVGNNCVHIVDDDDMAFFTYQVTKGKSTVLHTVYIKKIEKCLKVNASSSNTFEFDLNLLPDGWDENEIYHTYNQPVLSNDQVDQPENEIYQNTENEIYQNTEPVLSNDQVDHKWKSNTFTYMPPPPEHPTHLPKVSVANNCKKVIKTGDEFDSKELCAAEIGEKALLEGFQFRPRKSDRFRYDVVCRGDDCEWKIISSLAPDSGKWVVGKVNDVHTCDRTELFPDHRNATAKLLGHLLIPKMGDPSRVYKPKDIVNDINLEYNIDVSYKKAWCGRNIALEMLSGCPKNSFSQLPYYCYNLKLKNPGWVTHIETDDEDQFEMVFIAFGVAVEIYDYIINFSF